MATKKNYRIRINDYYTDPDKCNEIDLEIEYPTLEMASDAGWSIIEAFAAIHGLGYENQGGPVYGLHKGGRKSRLGCIDA